MPKPDPSPIPNEANHESLDILTPGAVGRADNTDQQSKAKPYNLPLETAKLGKDERWPGLDTLRVLTIVGSSVLYFGVENPCLSIRKRLLKFF
jgi:hypothetical protein